MTETFIKVAVPPKKEKPHYVDGKAFSENVIKYIVDVRLNREAHIPDPKIPDSIGSAFIKIAEGLSHKPGFISYTFRDEMVLDAVENCVKAIRNYKPEATTRSGAPTTAFKYFTQICFFAFVRRIQKEERQRDTRAKMIDECSVDAFADVSGGESGDSVIERIRHRDQLFRDTWYKEEVDKEKPIDPTTFLQPKKFSRKPKPRNASTFDLEALAVN